MSASTGAVHEVDGKRMHAVFDDDAEPSASPAYRMAEALLGIYLSRVDFLKQRALESRGHNRLGKGPMRNAQGPSAIH